MSAENLPKKEDVSSQESGILNKIRNRANDLINLGFLQTRMWMITTGITIIAATYGIEFSGDIIKRLRAKRKNRK